MKNYDILKIYCKYIFFVGSGNFWHEENNIGDDKSLWYRVYQGILCLMFGSMTILEVMAALIGEFPEDEKRDSVTFAVSHTIVMAKIFSVVTKKKLILELNKKMVELCTDHEDEDLMKGKYRIMRINIIAYCVIVYVCTTCFVIEGIRKCLTGSHFATVITYYPYYEDNSALATFFRIFTTVILFLMLATMVVSVDLFTVAHLIMYKYKFITLRQYFEKLREDFDRLNKNGNRIGATEKLASGLVEGVEMHKKILALSKDIDKAFGTVMALQVCQSFGSAVSLLLQIALSDQLAYVAIMKIICFVMALFFLLAVFLCNAGEITYQASILSEAIFYCGWHESELRKMPAGRNVRRIVLLAVMQAQRPLLMKAFNMLELTYATFIQVVRGTYSVFALFYAQNQGASSL